MSPIPNLFGRCLRISPQTYPRHAAVPMYASTISAITPAPSIEQMTTSIPPIARYPPTQPPSYHPPEDRRSQLHRQYASFLRSTPVMLFFQHNNLTANEWMAVRRELAQALQKFDDSRAAEGREDTDLMDGIKISIIKSGVFAAALRVVEYYRPEQQPYAVPSHPINPATQSSARLSNTLPTPDDPALTHALSRAAREAVINKKKVHPLAPLLSGPLAVLSFPSVSPQHMKAALSILSPKSPNFPAPTRKANPGYHELVVQIGLQKLILLGARVEGKVFDVDSTRWAGAIEGGLEGLRGQLVTMLQGYGAGLTNTLESAGKSLHITMDSRRGMLDDELKKEDGDRASNEPSISQ